MPAASVKPPGRKFSHNSIQQGPSWALGAIPCATHHLRAFLLSLPAGLDLAACPRAGSACLAAACRLVAGLAGSKCSSLCCAEPAACSSISTSLLSPCCPLPPASPPPAATAVVSSAASPSSSSSWGVGSRLAFFLLLKDARWSATTRQGVLGLTCFTSLIVGSVLQGRAIRASISQGTVQQEFGRRRPQH